MAIGIEIVGGGNHKFTRTSVSVEGEGSKGVIVKNTIGNEFTDVQISARSSKEKFKEIQNVIFNIQDRSINQETKNTYREDVLSKLPILIKADNEEIVKKTHLDYLHY